MKLFVVTKLSDYIIHELLDSPNSLMITNVPSVAEEVRSFGIVPQLLSIEQKFTAKETDRLFYDEFMPGRLSGIDINGMPIYEALSIDRLKFWFNGDPAARLVDIVSMLDFDELIISMDMWNYLPWAVADLVDCPVTGIKVAMLRTREFCDYYRHAHIDTAIVSFLDEKELLESIDPTKKVISGTARPKRRPVDVVKKQTLREGLKISKGTIVTGVVYDKRDEWQFRRMLILLKQGGIPWNIAVFPYDERSKRLFYQCVPRSLRAGMRIAIYDDF